MPSRRNVCLRCETHVRLLTVGHVGAADSLSAIGHRKHGQNAAARRNDDRWSPHRSVFPLRSGRLRRNETDRDKRVLASFSPFSHTSAHSHPSKTSHTRRPGSGRAASKCLHTQDGAMTVLTLVDAIIPFGYGCSLPVALVQIGAEEIRAAGRRRNCARPA